MFESQYDALVQLLQLGDDLEDDRKDGEVDSLAGQADGQYSCQDIDASVDQCTAMIGAGDGDKGPSGGREAVDQLSGHDGVGVGKH